MADEQAAAGPSEGAGEGRGGARVGRKLLQLGAMAGVAALVAVAARRRARQGPLGGAEALPLALGGEPGRGTGEKVRRRGGGRPLSASLTIQRSPQEIYEFWRHLPNLARTMRHVASIEVVDERTSRWVVKGAAGNVTWESLLVEDVPGERLVWQSTAGSPVEQSGRLELVARPDGRGTVAAVEMQVRAASGAGRAVAAILRPLAERELREDLRRVKNVLEAGEVPTNRGQAAGERGALDLKNPF